MRSDAQRLDDILVAIAKIRERAVCGFGGFLGDEMLQIWTMTQKDLPGLERQIQLVRSQVSPGPGPSF